MVTQVHSRFDLPQWLGLQKSGSLYCSFVVAPYCSTRPLSSAESSGSLVLFLVLSVYIDSLLLEKEKKRDQKKTVRDRTTLRRKKKLVPL